MGLSRDICLILTHKADEQVRILYKSISTAYKGDVCLLSTRKLGEEFRKLGILCTISLAESEIFTPEYQHKSKSKTIIPGNSDLTVLAFWRYFSHYRFFWIVEYDVFNLESFSILNDIDECSNVDLICTHIRPYEWEPNWPCWSSLRVPNSSSSLDSSILNIQRMGGFFPLARFSGRMLRECDTAYRQGWEGHYEAVIPTLARTIGLSMRDLNEFAKIGGHDKLYSLASFNHKASQAEKRHMFYHPIKGSARCREMEAELIGLE